MVQLKEKFSFNVHKSDEGRSNVEGEDAALQSKWDEMKGGNRGRRWWLVWCQLLSPWQMLRPYVLTSDCFFKKNPSAEAALKLQIHPEYE